jgi:release factor glutamine methyltransferase
LKDSARAIGAAAASPHPNPLPQAGEGRAWGAGERAPTVAAALAVAASRLVAAGVADPRRDARLLLGAALGVEPGALLGWPERHLSAEEEARFAASVARRAAREPVSRILGRREFWGLSFRVVPETLDPRPDSETLIEAALATIPDRTAPLRLVDFGTGTGCLLLALLSELPNATGLGIDRAPAALVCAAGNARELGLVARARFIASDWGAAFSGSADLILANPPYIESHVIEGLEPEVSAYEPRVALDGGTNGLDAYRVLVHDARRLLTPQGIGFLEIGAGQAGRVSTLVEEVGLRVRGIRRDLAEVERCLVVSRA